MKSEWGIGIGSKADRMPIQKSVNVPEVVPEDDGGLLGLVIDGIGAIAKFLIVNNEIFIIVAVCGMMVVITGRKELGTKITSGSIIAYVITKAVENLC